MRRNFDRAFVIVLRLEGPMSTDLKDPGNINRDGSAGLTIWGLSSKYNPTVNENTTIEEAREIYLEKYWIGAGCDDAPFPMDVCLFDGAVNPQNDPHIPGAGNKEILGDHPGDWMGCWQDFLLQRAIRYMKNSNERVVKGHLFRILKLYQAILDW